MNYPKYYFFPRNPLDILDK